MSFTPTTNLPGTIQFILVSYRDFSQAGVSVNTKKKN